MFERNVLVESKEKDFSMNVRIKQYSSVKSIYLKNKNKKFINLEPAPLRMLPT